MTHDENKSMTGFPERFTAFMEARKLNSNSLATQLGEKNPVKYRRWASGEAVPNAESLLIICKQYHISMDWLMLGTGQMELPNSKLTKTQGTSTPNPALSSDGVNWSELYQDLSGKYSELEAAFKVVAEQVNGLTKQNKLLEFIINKLDPSFTGSSSQFTAMMKAYQQIGFDYCKNIAPKQELPVGVVEQVQAECIVREMYPHSNLNVFANALSNSLAKQA